MARSRIAGAEMKPSGFRALHCQGMPALWALTPIGFDALEKETSLRCAIAMQVSHGDTIRTGVCSVCPYASRSRCLVRAPAYSTSCPQSAARLRCRRGLFISACFI